MTTRRRRRSTRPSRSPSRPAAAHAPSPNSSCWHSSAAAAGTRSATNAPWILGAAQGLDSPCSTTPATDSVSFATSDGQSFYLFAGDPYDQRLPRRRPTPTPRRLRRRLKHHRRHDRQSHHRPLSAVNPQQALRGQTLSVTRHRQQPPDRRHRQLRRRHQRHRDQRRLPDKPHRDRRDRRQRHLRHARRHRHQPRTGAAPHSRPASRSPPCRQPTLTLRFEGKLRDRVGKANGMPPADGAARRDLQGHRRGRQRRTHRHPTRAARHSSAAAAGTRSATNAPWILGAAPGLDSPCSSTPATDSVSFATSDGQSFYLFAGDPTPSQFTAGAQIRLRAVIADGSSTTVDMTIP